MTLKKLWISFVMSSIVALGFRAYQVLFLIDASTGFLNKSSEITLYGMIGILFLSLIILCLESINVQGFPEEFELGTNIPAGVFLLITTVFTFMGQVNNFFSGKVTNAIEMVSLILGIAAGIVLLLMTIGAFIGKNLFEKLPVLSAFLPLWMAVNVVYLTFVKYTNVVNISDNMLHILSTLSLIVFFFTYSKLVSGVKTDKTIRRSFGIGLITLVFFSAYLFPHILSNAINGVYISVQNMVGDIADLSLLLYILCFLLELTAAYNVFCKKVNRQKVSMANNTRNIKDDTFPVLIGSEADNDELNRQSVDISEKKVNRAEEESIPVYNPIPNKVNTAESKVPILSMEQINTPSLQNTSPTEQIQTDNEKSDIDDLLKYLDMNTNENTVINDKKTVPEYKNFENPELFSENESAHLNTVDSSVYDENIDMDKIDKLINDILSDTE